jgi:hypothetical protein
MAYWIGYFANNRHPEKSLARRQHQRQSCPPVGVE